MTHYEQDFYGWTQEQAALMKAGQFNALDITNLIEEIETMGRSEKRELESRLTVLLLHLLKWQYQEVRRGRSWELSIDEQRFQFAKTLKENPSLKPALADLLKDAYKLSVIQASRATKIGKSVFPDQCPWTFEQITDDGFLPD